MMKKTARARYEKKEEKNANITTQDNKINHNHEREKESRKIYRVAEVDVEVIF